MDVLFNGVQWNDGTVLFVDKKSAPDRHFINRVIFRDGAFSEKVADVVAKWTNWVDWAAGIAESVERKDLGPSLPLPADFKNRQGHGGRAKRGY